MSVSFEGEIILVYLKHGGIAQQAGVALEKPKLETRFGQEFLVGRVPVNERDWASGLQAAVLWSEVQHYLVFESRAEYDARIGAAPAFWEIAASQDPS